MNMERQNRGGGNPGNENRTRNNSQNASLIDSIKNDAAKILRKEEDRYGEMLFEYAEKVGKKAKEDRITVSQIRKIFSEVKKLEYDEEGNYRYRLRIVKSQMAYTAGRFSNLKDFRNIFNVLIDETLKGGEEELKRFKNFFEAVIAYHRAYGGS